MRVFLLSFTNTKNLLTENTAVRLEFNKTSQNLNVSTVKLSTDFNDELGDFYSEIGDPGLDCPQPSALPQSMVLQNLWCLPHIVHINNNNNNTIIFLGVLIYSQHEPHNDGQVHRVIPKETTVYSTHANPDHCTDVDDHWSGSLDVTFDVGLNDWDDFDDGNLVDASEVCCESQICNLMTDHDQPTNFGLFVELILVLFFAFYVFWYVRYQ